MEIVRDNSWRDNDQKPLEFGENSCMSQFFKNHLTPCRTNSNIQCLDIEWANCVNIKKSTHTYKSTYKVTVEKWQLNARETIWTVDFFSETMTGGQWHLWSAKAGTVPIQGSISSKNLLPGSKWNKNIFWKKKTKKVCLQKTALHTWGRSQARCCSRLSLLHERPRQEFHKFDASLGT